MEILGVIDRLIVFGAALWRRHRFGPRARIELSWQHVPISFADAPNPRWRVLSLEVTASRTDEFVIAKGTVEATRGPHRGWQAVADLADLLELPVVVEANRQWQGSLSGQSLAEKLESSISGASARAPYCRVKLHDLHKTRILSEPLQISLAELRREERD